MRQGSRRTTSKNSKSLLTSYDEKPTNIDEIFEMFCKDNFMDMDKSDKK